MAQVLGQLERVSYQDLQGLMAEAAFVAGMSMQASGGETTSARRAQILALGALTDFGEANYPQEMQRGGGLHKRSSGDSRVPPSYSKCNNCLPFGA